MHEQRCFCYDTFTEPDPSRQQTVSTQTPAKHLAVCRHSNEVVMTTNREPGKVEPNYSSNSLLAHPGRDQVNQSGDAVSGKGACMLGTGAFRQRAVTALRYSSLCASVSFALCLQRRTTLSSVTTSSKMEQQKPASDQTPAPAISHLNLRRFQEVMDEVYGPYDPSKPWTPKPYKVC